MWIVCLVGLIVTVSGKDVDYIAINTTVHGLFRKILEAQNLEDKPLTPPPSQWAKKKGLFDSHVKMNFHGRPDFTAMRDLVKIYDNNMFATSWVTTLLLEAHKYGIAPKPPDETINRAIEAIGKFSDHNRNYNNSLYGFWLQKYNETVKTWQAHPENLLAMYAELANMEWGPILNWLNDHGMDNIMEIILYMLATTAQTEQSFLLPPDFDDSFVNIGLGSLLATVSEEHRAPFETWKKQNSNVTSVIDAMKHYAYRPFGAENRSSIIDCRTYYYIRHFLNHTMAQSKKDPAFIPTWVQDVEDLKTWYDRGVIMPIKINNVDVTVSANALYGLINGIVSGVLPETILDDSDVFNIYNTTLNLISYEIQHNFTSRPDLALVYYPSKYEFYWFVSRTYFTVKDTGISVIPNIKQVRDELGISMKSRATPAILRQAMIMPGEDVAFIDDFLGNADINMQHESVEYPQDRIYTTAMAVNTLINVWTTYSKTSGKLYWDSDTPEDVKTFLKYGVNWLTDITLSETYRPWNAFFSGSYKGYTTAVAAYPLNMMAYVNGTVIPDHNKIPEGGVSGAFYFGVQGYIDEAEYLKMETEPHLGYDSTPTVFHGFNADPHWFTFWSSKTYTYAAALLSLSTYMNIET